MEVLIPFFFIFLKYLNLVENWQVAKQLKFCEMDNICINYVLLVLFKVFNTATVLMSTILTPTFVTWLDSETLI